MPITNAIVLPYYSDGYPVPSGWQIVHRPNQGDSDIRKGAGGDTLFIVVEPNGADLPITGFQATDKIPDGWTRASYDIDASGKAPTGKSYLSYTRDASHGSPIEELTLSNSSTLDGWEKLTDDLLTHAGTGTPSVYLFGKRLA
ncbi:hypothetical protein AB0D49_40615 [Streptomyces sp. NPDC048290]|uniref:hypothetical protein n=1 Tax=Streptomyces sp. NPDC048290 TaxID=3155811 RepID=UPI00342B2EBD